MKRFLALLLAAVLVMGLAVPAFADEYNAGYNGNGYDYENGYYYENDHYDENGYYNENGLSPVAAYRRTITGYVSDITQVGNYYEAKILDDAGKVLGVVAVPVTGGFVFEYATGLPASLADHGDNKVIAVVNYEYDALAFAINAEGMLNLHTIEALEWEGDTLLATVDGGGLILTLNEDTDLVAWLTRQVVTLDEFQVGDEVVFWYGFVALSFPAYATPSRALRLVPAQQDVDVEYPYEYPQPEAALELEGGIVRAGINLYRVNLNAEAAGYTVSWNNGLRRAELTKNGVVITLAVDSAVFYINGEAFTMQAPSLLEGGRLFAPADFFAKL